VCGVPVFNCYDNYETAAMHRYFYNLVKFDKIKFDKVNLCAETPI
jgi:hypothetical protein